MHKHKKHSVKHSSRHRSTLRHGQSLPMTTIVLIIISIVVLAVVVIFFFGQFGEGQKTVGAQMQIGSNATSKVKCDSWGAGFMSITQTECQGCELSVIQQAITDGRTVTNSTGGKCIITTTQCGC